jgi:glutamate-ammonia-ligase adenylyltransferase
VNDLTADVRQLAETRATRLKELGQQRGALSGQESYWGDLAKVLAGSEFIARALSGNPSLLDKLDAVQSPARQDTLRRQIDDLHGGREEVGAALRRVRQEEIVRLGWRDLVGDAPLSEVLETLSTLADAAIEAALRCAHSELVSRFGQPIGETSGTPVQLTVLGLGKLGGRELNMSSDVDLVFAYRENGSTNGVRSISNHEFFIKLGRALIDILQTPTAEGIVFRVDMRLRPNGDSGPLALSFDAIDHYFLTHGREWERYALIKARPVAGDIASGHELLANLRPFVYRKYLDFGAFESIRSMKTLIDRELAKKSLAGNVKLGRGGIREIEFIVQSHQLIYGGRNAALRTSALYDALTVLEEEGMLDQGDCDMLRDHYDYLRVLEHRLQIMDDAQTHAIPVEPLARTRIALAMGYRETAAFEAAIASVNDDVHRLFRSVFHHEREPNTDDHESVFADLWDETLAPEDQLTQLKTLGFKDPQQVQTLLAGIRHSRFYQAFSREGRERLDALMPLVLKSCTQTDRPDTAISRVLFVIESIGRRSAYLALLSENTLALSQLIRLVSASNEISHWIASHPVILDELIDPITAYQPQDGREIGQELERKLRSHDGEDLEAAMEALREYRQAYSLRIAAADVAGLVEIDTAAASLSALAEALLCQALAVAGRTLKTPKAPQQDAELGIIAYGKLGSRELGYHSDLDIVFIYEQPDSEDPQTAAARRHYFGRLVQRLVHILTTHTPAGEVYSIDTRLRPSGNAGTVVTPIKAYHEYLSTSAWTFEHQALVRARMITGSEALRRHFDKIRRNVLCQPREASKLQKAMRDMRQRMQQHHSRNGGSGFDLKHDAGGLVDIEFLCQYLVLKFAHRHPALTRYHGNLRILSELAASGAIASETADTLSETLRRYLAKENELKLGRRKARLPEASFVSEREAVRRLWHQYLEPTSP